MMFSSSSHSPAVSRTRPIGGERVAVRLLLGFAIFAHVVFLVALRTEWLSPLFNDAMHRFGPGCDFFSIYAAGVKALGGEAE